MSFLFSGPEYCPAPLYVPSKPPVFLRQGIEHVRSFPLLSTEMFPSHHGYFKSCTNDDCFIFHPATSKAVGNNFLTSNAAASSLLQEKDRFTVALDKGNLQKEETVSPEVSLFLNDSSFLTGSLEDYIERCVGELKDPSVTPERYCQVLLFLAYLTELPKYREVIMNAYTCLIETIRQLMLDRKYNYSCIETPLMLLCVSLISIKDDLSARLLAERNFDVDFFVGAIVSHQKCIFQSTHFVASLGLMIGLRHGGVESRRRFLRSAHIRDMEICLQSMDSVCFQVETFGVEAFKFPNAGFSEIVYETVRHYQDNMKETLYEEIQCTLPLFLMRFQQNGILRLEFLANKREYGATWCRESPGWKKEVKVGTAFSEFQEDGWIQRQLQILSTSPLNHPFVPVMEETSAEEEENKFFQPPDENCLPTFGLAVPKNRVAVESVEDDNLLLCESDSEMTPGQSLSVDSWEGKVECERKKTYAQACNDAAAPVFHQEKTSEESAILQSYLDTMQEIREHHLGGFNSSEDTDEGILKRTVEKYRKKHPGCRLPLETSALFRKVLNVGGKREEEIRISSPTTSNLLRVKAVRCARWTENLQKLAQLSFEDVEEAKVGELKILVPYGDQFKIGESHFGNRVTLALEILPNQEKKVIAVREVKRDSTADYCVRRLQDFTRTIRADICHLLPYEHIFDLLSKWVLARDLCDWNLDEYLKRHFEKQETVLPLFFQMLKGLQFMHRNNPILFHGNLKPNNILIDCHGTLRLVDFGFGRLCALKHQYPGPCFNHYNNTYHPICWKPPEFYCISTTYTGRSDIHSAGMIAFYMMKGGREHPFVTYPQMLARELQEKVCSGDHYIHSLPEEAVHLLEMMLQVDAEDRPEASQLINHPFFWTNQKRLSFLLAVAQLLSDCREYSGDCSVETRINEGAGTFSSGNWRFSVAEELLEEVEEKNREPTVSGLLLFMLDMHKKGKSFAKSPEIFLHIFPDLFVRVFSVVERSPWTRKENIKEFLLNCCDRAYG